MKNIYTHKSHQTQSNFKQSTSLDCDVFDCSVDEMKIVILSF